MKKLFTLIAFAMLSLTMMAQSQEPMKFVGNSTFGGTFMGMTVSQSNENDEIIFQMKSTTEGDITIPALTFTQMGMTIPSFTIHNAAFTFNMAAFEAIFDEQAINETITVNGAEKTITGTLNSAAYKHADNSFSLNVTYKYGSMPGSITYDITAYYVADSTAIENISKLSENNTIYDLNGRVITTPQIGQIYIINGKKVMAN